MSPLKLIHAESQNGIDRHFPIWDISNTPSEGSSMIVVHWGKAKKFFQSRAGTNAEAGLKQWKKLVQASDWKTFADIQQTIKSADWVDGYVVFNICHNNYRLITIVRFEKDRLYIQEILEHKEYEKNKWKR